MSLPEAAKNLGSTVAAFAGVHGPSMHGNDGQTGKPAENRAVVYDGKQKVNVYDIGYPKMQDPQGNPMDNGVILKVLLGAICGSDLHAYNGRSTAVAGKLVFGHEITGEVFEKGPAVHNFKVGDWVSVPFNITCGTCENCKSLNFHACLTTNHEAPGIQCGIFGYPLSGGWQGGQAQYVFIPHADFQLLKIPDEVKQNPKKLIDIAMLADIWPTAHHGCVEAEVGVGKSVYIAGAGPVGLLAAVSALMLGAANVFVGDVNPERLPAVEKIGAIPVDLSKMDTTQAQEFIKSKNFGHENVDCAVECVGFEASGHGRHTSQNEYMNALDTCVQYTKAAGHVGVIGVFLPADPGAPDASAKAGKQTWRYGDSWIKGLSLHGGQAPVQRYNRHLLQMILYDKVTLADKLNAKVISLDEAPEAYKKFVAGEYVKYLIDPHNTIPRV